MIPAILQQHPPDVALIQIGGNDISTEYYNDLDAIASQLQELARALRRGGVRRVFLGKLLFRAMNRRYLPTKMAVQVYNYKVRRINTFLDQMAARLQHEGIVVWNHKGHEECAQDWLADDGTHLNARGAAKYWWSWRRALISTHTAWNGLSMRAFSQLLVVNRRPPVLIRFMLCIARSDSLMPAVAAVGFP